MKKIKHTIQAGEFKAKCLQLMDEVNTKHISIIITKHGKPVAQLIPIDATPQSFFGCLKGSVSINADLTQSLDEHWEANE